MLEIFDKSAAMHAWFSSPEARVYLSDLERKRAKVYGELKDLKDPFAVAKALGMLIAYEESLELPAKLKEHLQRMKKLKEE